MKKSDKLKQQRAAKLQAQKKIIDLVKTENREFTEDENGDMDALDAEIQDLDKAVEKAEKQEARELRIAAMAGTVIPTEDNGEDKEMKKIAKRYSFLRAVQSVIVNECTLDGVEKEMNDEAIREAQILSLEGFNVTKQAFSIPSSMVRATAQTVTEDAGKFGAKLVTTEIRPVEGFIPKLFLEEAGATFLTGLTGNVLLPKFSDYEYKWLSEREKIVLKASEIDGPELKPKRAGAGVSISNQLLLQSSISVEDMIYNKLRQASARALNKAALNGDGIKEPLGILNTPGILTAKATAQQNPSWKTIVELWGLLSSDNVDTANGTYLANSKLVAELRTIQKDAGSGRFLLEDGLIDGTRTIVTNLIEELTGLQTLIYGDFSEMYIGQWGGVNFVADPVGGLSSGETLIYSNLYSNIAIANPNAFAVNKFLKA